MNSATQRICLLAVGIALFVALSVCVQVPVFENYYLCLGYVVMAAYCYCFGALCGALTGALGAALYCVVINGLRGMIGWALGNIAIGAIIGVVFQATKRMKSAALRTALNAVAVAAAAALGMLVVKSGAESLLYGQPFALRAAKNTCAFVADAITLLVSLPLCAVLDRPARTLLPALAR